MDPPFPPATNPMPEAVPHASYAESVESSPRSRTTETWDDRESLTAAPSGGKLRLMCSYGGHIVTRPHDKSLCYVGGDTKMVVVDRNFSLGELKARLSKTLLQNRAFTIKYQLPNEDLDALISVTNDEDLENMIDEFDRICASSSAAKSSRLRVFLFVNKRESGSSIESILEGSVKSEDWFYNALNGSGETARGITDANSVNSLLGLDSEIVTVNNGGNLRSGNSRESDALQADLSKNQKSGNQDALLNQNSLMNETSSSLGETSSPPLPVNLPPIRVRVENGVGNKVQDQRGTVEEQFAKMSVSAGGKQDEGFAAMASPQIPTTLLPAAAVPGVPINPVMTGAEFSERIVSDDERSDQGVPVGYTRRQPQPELQAQSQQKHQQKPIFSISSLDSTSSDGSTLYQDPVAQIPLGITRVTSNPMNSNNPSIPAQQKVPESGYLLHSQLDKQQLQPQQLQPQQLQPQQFIHPGTQYIQHPQGALPISQYYHLYPPPTQHRHPQHDQQQYPLYFIPPTAGQPQQAYNMSMQQTTFSEHLNAVPSAHPQNPPVPTMLTNPAAFNNQPRIVEHSNAVPSAQPQNPPVPTMLTNPAAFNNQPRIVMAPGNPEMASNGYRTAIPNAQPMVQVTPGQHQQYMAYSQVHHPSQSMAQPQHPAPAPAPATNSNFSYDYSDPDHVQVYYTQPLAHTHPAQYQAMVSSSPMVMLSDASAQNLNDKIKQQNRTAQPQ